MEIFNLILILIHITNEKKKRLAMDENEVKQERNIHIQSRLKLSQKKEQKESKHPTPILAV